ncbi:hypothetical protein JZU56_05360, partial [bacterium]|nr:hypothetical protein [bacterium]
MNTVRHPVGRRSVGAGRRGSATPRSPWRSPNDVAAPTAGVDDVDDREWPRPPRHASKYANSFRPGGVITSAKPGEFAVATDYDDARRRR